MTTQTAIRAIAWILFLVVASATLSPIGFRPTSGLPVNLERAVAFIALGAAFAVAYPRHVWLAAAFLVIGALGLEWLQNLRPDRHGREMDAVVKIAGAGVGLALGWIILTTAKAVRQRGR